MNGGEESCRNVAFIVDTTVVLVDTGAADISWGSTLDLFRELYPFLWVHSNVL